MADDDKQQQQQQQIPIYAKWDHVQDAHALLAYVQLKHIAKPKEFGLEVRESQQSHRQIEAVCSTYSNTRSQAASRTAFDDVMTKPTAGAGADLHKIHAAPDNLNIP